MSLIETMVYSFVSRICPPSIAHYMCKQIGILTFEFSGGPLDLSEFDSDARVSAILWAGYPGEAGGAAIADVLFGVTAPAGRLPVTWHRESFVAAVTPIDERLRASEGGRIAAADTPGDADAVAVAAAFPGRTYRFFTPSAATSTQPPLYPFGHGLHYTRFGKLFIFSFRSRSHLCIVPSSRNTFVASSPRAPLHLSRRQRSLFGPSQRNAIRSS